MPADDANVSFGGRSLPHYVLLRCHSVRLLTPTCSVLLLANKAQLSLGGSQVGLCVTEGSLLKKTNRFNEASLAK